MAFVVEEQSVTRGDQTRLTNNITHRILREVGFVRAEPFRRGICDRYRRGKQGEEPRARENRQPTNNQMSIYR